RPRPGCLDQYQTRLSIVPRLGSMVGGLLAARNGTGLKELKMKEVISVTIVALALSAPPAVLADEVTLIAPGGMRCAVDRMTPEFERRTGHSVKATIGSGGGTHQQVVRGELFDVPIVQPPYQDVLASGNVVASSETPLATVPLVVVIRKGSPKPDISTADA